jgi:hypothetical protein
MAGIRRNVYKIIIKLTSNDEDDDKEFTINNMTQILLQNFADMDDGKPPGITKESFIFMLKDNYYINNDVLKSIKSTKVEKIKFTFKDYNNRQPSGIIDEFYTPIISYSYDNDVVIKTLQLILKFTSEHLLRLDLLKKSNRNTEDKKIKKPKRRKKVDGGEEEEEEEGEEISKNTKINELITAIRDFNNPTPAIVQEFIEKFKRVYYILTEKEVMSYLKSKYDNSTASEAEEFRKNLSKIMLKSYSDPDTKINLNQLETYQYFLNDKYIDYIFETIQNNTSAASKNNQQSNYGYRPNLLNTSEMIKQIIKENIKYVYPDKTNIETLAESEEQDILLFHNILYIIKKIYLLDTTIINYEDNDIDDIAKTFYIKNLTLEQNNPFKLDKFKTNNYYNVIIKFRCDIKYINLNPILKINYIIDDLEILDKTNQLKTNEFDPKNFFKNQDFKKYNSTYIYDTIDYKSINDKINKILNTIKIQKIIKSKEEIFFNETALKHFNVSLKINFKESDSKENDDKIKKKNINLNIIYFLKDILKLYNGKEIITNNNSYFIYDTLITGTINNITPEAPSSILKCYSIIQNKIITYNNFKKEKIIKNFYNKIETLQLQEAIPFNDEKFNIYKLKSRDNRIKRNTYYISIIFLCYKPDEKGNKPSLQKRLIGEVCLDRAKLLDKAFYDLFYSKLNIPETYLYNKLLNLQKSKQATTVKNKEPLLIKNKEDPPNLETKITGGKNNHTQKNKKYF